MISTFPEEFLADEIDESDFIIGDEFTDLSKSTKN
jgi:hypothetical protein